MLLFQVRMLEVTITLHIGDRNNVYRCTEAAQTHRLVFIDWVLDAASVLGHPGGVKYGDTRHA